MREKDVSNFKRKSNRGIGSISDIKLPRTSYTNIEPTIISSINKLIAKEINSHQRRIEFQRYLELFGYKPENTILQIHIAGFFNKKTS